MKVGTIAASNFQRYNTGDECYILNCERRCWYSSGNSDNSAKSVIRYSYVGKCLAVI